MTNRSTTLASVVVLTFLFGAVPACSQDRDWVADWEKAQRDRPSQLRSSARIAPEKEPGIPLVVNGRLFHRDGITPAGGVTIFAYQTDRTGVYNERGTRGWRLRGWAMTDAQGRFTFRTIRPGSYPRGSNPAHIHFTIEGPKVRRQWVKDLEFADDPFISASARRASAAAGKFASVAEVSVRDGVQHVNLNLRIEDEGFF